ncbi:TIR domain-containing protein [Marinifilum caeruleilacunae]|uniref:Thoeris protein ThsB TIR-like domain-containing protein n=1 Tax=Marinifilum caeruleilacunae TaxID=2499076 RepID=A0ABX1WXI6_9BACT|nr:TIR domain-containing protein [Marinifilum caeruleilacunae]NOU60821.1 hypothetical protein [Marinifilum caeruleilacunae]
MAIPRHKVFISFQHGCQEKNKPCGTKYILRTPSPQLGILSTIQNPLVSIPIVEFNKCNGYCGRNRLNPFQLNSKCSNYDICGNYWKERFEHLFSLNTDGFVNKAVNDGDIALGLKTETIRQKIRDEFIADATVTVVLIGPKTWSRKYVDWEIGSSIRASQKNPRCGLIGIFLPTHPDYGKPNYHPNIIPPRLYDNHKNGFASLHHWSENPEIVQGWIHDAFVRRNRINPDNSYPSFINNKSANGWQ